MRIISKVAEMQKLSKSWQRKGSKIGFVPTMGYLHDGHMSLVRDARKRVGKGGKIVVSIYVNPTQFGPKEDFSKYPRDLVRDKSLCKGENVDFLFVPSDAEMYPAEAELAFSTYVNEEVLSKKMEGISRPTHFRGVTTVVAKLFNIVLPDVAVFGAKDYQQAAVIQRMVRDLNFPVQIIVAPTRRESDGLAMSSRNKYLSEDERRQATVLWRAIQMAQESVRSSKRALPTPKLKEKLEKLICKEPAARLDYVEFFDPMTLEPAKVVQSGTHMAMAVFMGKTRLIDNARL